MTEYNRSLTIFIALAACVLLYLGSIAFTAIHFVVKFW